MEVLQQHTLSMSDCMQSPRLQEPASPAGPTAMPHRSWPNQTATWIAARPCGSAHAALHAAGFLCFGGSQQPSKSMPPPAALSVPHALHQAPLVPQHSIQALLQLLCSCFLVLSPLLLSRKLGVSLSLIGLGTRQLPLQVQHALGHATAGGAVMVHHASLGCLLRAGKLGDQPAGITRDVHAAIKLGHNHMAVNDVPQGELCPAAAAGYLAGRLKQSPSSLFMQ